MTSVDSRPASGLTRRAKVLLPFGLLVLVVLAVQRLWLGGGETEGIEFAGPTMGTTYAVKVVAPRAEGRERARIAAAIREELDEVDRLMSTYDPASEISRFNAHRSTAPFPLSRATVEVLATALAVSVQTDGAFDVTVGPLVDAWGFGPPGPPTQPPTDEALAAIRPHVGYTKLHLDAAASTVSKSDVMTVVDLSAVAKGYAADRVAERLAELGYRDMLVEVGGEIAARGARPDGTPWRVAVERPDSAGRGIFRVIGPVDEAVATSGDYRNHFELDGIRVAHIIDPHTGRPVPYAGASVSVVHARGADADAWATALTVLGPDDGYALAEREKIAALFVTRTSSGFVGQATSAFATRFDRSDGRR